MLLLHISDIHFRAPHCLTPDTDPTRPIRTRLLQDVAERIQVLGPVAAILVGGDIAFQGHPDEYKSALEWLTELARICGCPLERVFVVPGNHDVDRGIIRGSPATRNAQHAIKSAAEVARENELRTQFRDALTGPALMAPLAAYNDFAKRFNCQIYSPDRLSWIQEIPLGGGVGLRLHGLTSTLLSGVNGNDDLKTCLYLSPLQTVLDPVSDVVNLVLCHHPPDWFMDMEHIEDAISARAHVHLFGHKHRQRYLQHATYIRFDAGAVNPDRNEHDWRPGYNLINVDVTGQGVERRLTIEAHMLELQINPEQYRPILVHGGGPVLRHNIAIPNRALVAQVALVDTEEPAVATQLDSPADVEAAMGQERTRNLIFRFWNLTSSQRRKIATDLGLIGDSDLQTPEPERYGRALLLAGKRGLIDQLAQQIEEVEHL